MSIPTVQTLLLTRSLGGIGHWDYDRGTDSRTTVNAASATPSIMGQVTKKVFRHLKLSLQKASRRGGKHPIATYYVSSR